VETHEDMADLLTRLRWHFEPYADEIKSISIVSSLRSLKCYDQDAPFYLDPSMAPRTMPKSFKSKISIKAPRSLKLSKASGPKAEQAWLEFMNTADMVIVWRLPENVTGKVSPGFETMAELRKSVSEKVNIVVADRNARASEASLLLSAGLKLTGDQGRLESENHDKFLKFSKTISQEKCHIFGTGPSLSQVENHDFSDGDVITCNSFVVNDDLMEQMKPKVICAADPIDGMNLNMKTDFYVDPLPNVLTLLMIPIGGSCYDEMTISGCDGRPLDENQYFWGHHKGSQINDKMADIKVAHPGFFNIS